MKIRTSTRNAWICALALTLTPAAAMSATTSGGETTQSQNDDDFDWGLLGLLGLAGLLGLKKKDDHRGDGRGNTVR